MAATITAAPNPVLIPIGQKGKTTLTWNGAEKGRCRVFELVGTTETPIAPSSATGSVTGSVTVDIGAGSHTYRLRQAAAPRALVASVVVEVKHRNERVLAAVEEALTTTTAIPVQAITRVTVTPQAETALFAFRTLVPTVPVLTVSTNSADPSTVIARRFPLFGGARTSHVLEVDDLPQGTTLFFKISAGNPLLWYDPPAVLQGSFRTGQVNADIFFDSITVSSDSDDLSEGDLTFKFFAGNAETMTLEPGGTPVHQEGLSDGETAMVGKTIQIFKAPERVWAEVQCRDDDKFPIPYPGEGYSGLVGTPPGTGATTGFKSTDDYDYAWVRTELETVSGGTLQPGTRVAPWSMKTGGWKLAFEVFGRLQVTHLKGIGFRTDPAIPFNPASAFAQAVVARAAREGRMTMAALGPEGGVYYKSIVRDEPGLPRDEWIPLGGHFAGSLTLLALDDSRASLFALDAEGAAFHRSVEGIEAAGGDWQPLGGSFVGCLAVARGASRRIEVFGADREGRVLHRSLQPDGRDAGGDWRPVGEGVAGGLAPVYSARAGLALFALAEKGNVVFKCLDGEEWAGRWESLGGSFRGMLSAALLPDGGVLLVVIGLDRSVRTLSWASFPEEPPRDRWEDAGTIDALFESLASPTGSPVGTDE